MSFDEIAIRVEGVTKRFEIFNHPRDQLKQFCMSRVQKILGLKTRQYFREFLALQDVTFQVCKGEAYGIIGLNGSGKSTLLQIITGTMVPTTGKVETQGRISALLELGAGFNPEFTGRENVYMNGALLGFSQQQINEKFEEIQSFADIGDKFGQPLKSYSSGMQMRVAFAVATAFDPDILIIDEALAVGDAYFQQKCFHKIESFKARGGTLLFVSHDANVVKQLCDKAVLISHGRVISVGEPKSVIDLYEGLVAKKTDMGASPVEILQNSGFVVANLANEIAKQKTWEKATTIVTNQDAELLDFKFFNDANKEVKHIRSESLLKIQYKIKLNKFFERPAFGLIVRDRVGRSLFETSTYAMQIDDEAIAKDSVVEVNFTFNFNLRAGQYSFSIGVANKGFSYSEFEEYSLLMHDVDQLQVYASEDAIHYGGLFNMKPTVSLNVLDGK